MISLSLADLIAFGEFLALKEIVRILDLVALQELVKLRQLVAWGDNFEKALSDKKFSL